IPKHIRDRVFDPFFTTKEVGKGTGQGLTMAYKTIVSGHKGDLRFETTEGEGTTFVISLPLEVDVEEAMQVVA
ncbi:MAG: ATP-binding protein, partial [Gammaproteobacteria bacterium]|nr:ATP-binding protein [Gammaproteobacteria bacterium]